MSVTQVSAHTFEIGGMGVQTPQQPLEVATRVVTDAVEAAPAVFAKLRSAVPLAPSQTSERGPLTAKQMLAQMKARLKVVERELVAKAELERERDQLQRLIRAAKTEIDNVRRLRSAV